MQPTQKDIQELIAFLPEISKEDFKSVIDWHTEKGIMPYPNYNPLVDDFFKKASKECWVDYDYGSNIENLNYIKDKSVIAEATLDNIKTMLTFFCRGERFSDGHWGNMFNDGSIKLILERLSSFIENSSKIKNKRNR